MAPAHDPFAPADRRPRRSGLLPEVFEVGARSAGATDNELARIREFWWRGTPEDRASAEEMIAGLTPPEWAEFLEAWRQAMNRPEFDPWSDEDDDQEATSDASEAQDSTPADPAAVGTLAPGDVQVSLLGPDGEVIDHTAFAELVDMGPAPDGWVAAGWMRSTGDVDGEPMGIGMCGFVPADAKAALVYLAGEDLDPAFVIDTPEDQTNRARLVLAAELQRPAAGRRKKVLAAVADVLGEDEVNEQTLATGEGLGG